MVLLTLGKLNVILERDKNGGAEFRARRWE